MSFTLRGILLLSGMVRALQYDLHQMTRRSALLVGNGVGGAAFVLGINRRPGFATGDLQFNTADSGLQWADAKVGTGTPLREGSKVAIDYIMSTTGARYGSKIDSTVDRNEPYCWTLGDGSTIAGLEQAIMGDGKELPPMRPGGVRRVIIPSSLAYAALARPLPGLQYQECGGGPGPVPPQVRKEGDLGYGEFQRFKNIYCNANRPYQPDLVMDVKLFGKRTTDYK
jgi:hypothetical protein